MTLLKSYNHRARKKNRVEPKVQYTMDDMVRTMKFIQNYSMGSRKFSEHLSQKDAETLKKKWNEAHPTLSKLYREMHDRMRERQNAAS